MLSPLDEGSSMANNSSSGSSSVDPADSLEAYYEGEAGRQKVLFEFILVRIYPNKLERAKYYASFCGTSS